MKNSKFYDKDLLKNEILVAQEDYFYGRSTVFKIKTFMPFIGDKNEKHFISEDIVDNLSTDGLDFNEFETTNEIVAHVPEWLYTDHVPCTKTKGGSSCSHSGVCGSNITQTINCDHSVLRCEGGCCMFPIGGLVGNKGDEFLCTFIGGDINNVHIFSKITVNPNDYNIVGVL